MKRTISLIEPMLSQVNQYLTLLERAKQFHAPGMRLDALSKRKLVYAESDLKNLADIYKFVEKQGDEGSQVHLGS